MASWIGAVNPLVPLCPLRSIQLSFRFNLSFSECPQIYQAIPKSIYLRNYTRNSKWSKTLGSDISDSRRIIINTYTIVEFMRFSFIYQQKSSLCGGISQKIILRAGFITSNQVALRPFLNRRLRIKDEGPKKKTKSECDAKTNRIQKGEKQCSVEDCKVIRGCQIVCQSMMWV